MREFEVTFTAHHIMNVKAYNEDAARERAINEFDGDVNWETEVGEVK